MIHIRSFRTHLVTPSGVTNVVAPPYDSMSPEERASFGADHPENFINAIRSLEEFPDREKLSLRELLRENSAVLENCLKSKDFEYESQPNLFIYQLSQKEHTQTGIVAEVPLSDYHEGLIRGHESTRSDHEDHLYQYLKAVRAVSSPICATYRGNSFIEKIVSETAKDPAWLDFQDDYGVTQKIWRVTDLEVQSRLEALFREVPLLYLTDGHHRVAAGARHAKQQILDHQGDGPWNYLLMALFPIDHMRILAFNRCIKDRGDVSINDVMDGLSKVFSVEHCQPDEFDFYGPRRRGEFVLLIDNRYYRLIITPKLIPDHPVECLDVSLLQKYVLEPLLGIRNPRSDPRLDYISGDLGLTGLRERCSSGWRVGFACYPPSFDQLTAVADAGLQMPPKSTCFDPKVRSGIFVRRL